ncbi:hypothetical protein DYQ05_04855 [Treponema pedis]|nr:hypothetical protein DYQ05_04855 [Treponema pedis]
MKNFLTEQSRKALIKSAVDEFIGTIKIPLYAIYKVFIRLVFFFPHVSAYRYGRYFLPPHRLSKPD